MKKETELELEKKDRKENKVVELSEDELSMVTGANTMGLIDNIDVGKDSSKKK